MRAVCIHLLLQRVRGETCIELPQPGAPWETSDISALGHQLGEGGVLQPGEACTKTGKPDIDVLRVKHLVDRSPSATSLDAYSGCPPELVPLDLT